MKNKKGINAIITTIFLLLIAILAVSTFDIWYTQYISKIFVNTEKNINAYNIEIEGYNNGLYIRSNQPSQISILKIENIDCTIINNTLAKGINNINITGLCITSITNNSPGNVFISAYSNSSSDTSTKTIIFKK